MPRPATRPLVLAAVLAAGLIGASCRRTFVVVPRPAGGYTRVDTLRGRLDGRDVRVTFYFDTTWRTDTVVRYDTLWRGGTRLIVRVDTLRVGRVDTIRTGRVDTLIRRDTVRLPARPATPTATINPRMDTLRAEPAVPIPPRVDTVRVRDTVRVIVRDTVRIGTRDTVRLIVRDTVLRVDTIRVAGRRVLFVPPGHYPPEGQCRVWIHDQPPGQQARPAACNALGAIPEGAFILFGGEAWDADYDWVGEARRSRVPPEIVALTRPRGNRRP